MAIIVYSIPNCTKCAAAKATLKRKNIQFEEKNIDESQEHRKELGEKLEHAGMLQEEVNMPVLDIEGTIIEGFDKEKILATLKEKGIGD